MAGKSPEQKGKTNEKRAPGVQQIKSVNPMAWLEFLHRFQRVWMIYERQRHGKPCGPPVLDSVVTIALIYCERWVAGLAEGAVFHSEHLLPIFMTSIITATKIQSDYSDEIDLDNWSRDFTRDELSEHGHWSWFHIFDAHYVYDKANMEDFEEKFTQAMDYKLFVSLEEFTARALRLEQHPEYYPQNPLTEGFEINSLSTRQNFKRSKQQVIFVFSIEIICMI